MPHQGISKKKSGLYQNPFEDKSKLGFNPGTKLNFPDSANNKEDVTPGRNIKYLAGGNVEYTHNGVTRVITNEEYRNLISREQQQGGTKPSKDAQAIENAPTSQQVTQQNQANQAERLQGQIGGQPIITEQDILNAVPQEPGLEALQAGGAGVAGVLSGATAGAVIGSAVPGIGNAIGAVAGGIIGGIGGTYGKISYDKHQDVAQAKVVYNQATKNFAQTTNALNAGTITKEKALERWHNDRIALYAARINIKRETDSDLNRFTSGGAREISEVEDRIRDLETIYQPAFTQALIQPDPSKVIIPQETEQ